MSIEALDWAFKLRLDDVTAKAVLLALCNHYNLKNHGCWPSVDTLCRETGATRRTVQRALRRLERWCLIVKDEGPRSTFFEVKVGSWFPSAVIAERLPDDELLLFGISIKRRRWAGVDRIVENLVENLGSPATEGVRATRGGVIECTHPWQSDALIIIEPEMNLFEDREKLAGEIQDWEFRQIGWVPPPHVKPSCIVGEDRDAQ